MTSSMLYAMCLLAALFHGAGGSLVMDVTPSNISPGLTKSLTINCTFSYAEVTNISSIISLVVSKSDQQEQFMDLVSVNVFSPDEITTFSQVDGLVSGHMDPEHESYLSVVWAYPSSNVTGLYKCEINGMDSHGHPSAVSQTRLVTSQELDMDQLINKVTQLQRQLESQENIAKNQSNEIDTLSTLAKHQSTEIITLSTLANNQSNEINKLLSLTKTQSEIISTQQSQLDNQSLTIAQIQKKLQAQGLLIKASVDFNISLEYNGRYYLLSKQDWTNSTVAAKTCEDYGGYLVQIDDSNENQFVKDFVRQYYNQYAQSIEVLVSGSDTGHEGRWTFTGTNTDLVFYDWRPNEPTGGQGLNCIILERVWDWQWNDIYCTHSNNNWKFLCELETE